MAWLIHSFLGPSAFTAAIPVSHGFSRPSVPGCQGPEMKPVWPLAPEVRSPGEEMMACSLWTQCVLGGPEDLDVGQTAAHRALYD